MVTYPKRGRRPRGARRGARERRGPAFAALDLGTNNCRLLIAVPTGPGEFEVIDAFSRIVRLGEGLGQNGRLSDAAMRRTVEALRICARKIRRAGVAGLRIVATEACRRASNCDDFLDRVSAQTGLEIETISTAEEVRLVLRGCMPLLDDQPRHAIVFDIGGGSTEVVWLHLEGTAPEILDWVSMPHGVVTLSEQYGDDPMSADAYAQLIGEIDAYLAPICDRHGIADAVTRGEVQMLGTSGTVTTLSGLHLGLARYDRSQVDGTYLAFDAIDHISHRLRELDCDGRAAQPCIGAERADLVVAGCAVLQAMCARWPVGRLRVADRGIREGILCELMTGAWCGAAAVRHGA